LRSLNFSISYKGVSMTCLYYTFIKLFDLHHKFMISPINLCYFWMSNMSASWLFYHYWETWHLHKYYMYQHKYQNIHIQKLSYISRTSANSNNTFWMYYYSKIQAALNQHDTIFNACKVLSYIINTRSFSILTFKCCLSAIRYMRTRRKAQLPSFVALVFNRRLCWALPGL